MTERLLISDSETSFATVNGSRVRYRRVGAGFPIVILHGWGSSIDAWGEVQRLLGAAGYAAYAIDLPGFGESDPPNSPWSVGDYVALVRAFLADRKLTQVALVGHSFGGRIGIKLASSPAGNNLTFLVLTGSAGLRHPLTLRQRSLQLLAKGRKVASRYRLLRPAELAARRLLQRVAGETDYQRAQGMMRPTMTRVVEEDLAPLLPQVHVPTLLVWGNADHVTPLADGELMQRLIPAAQLIVIPHGTHRLPYEQPRIFVELVTQALAEGGIAPSST